jgi:hypothetical protein
VVTAAQPVDAGTYDALAALWVSPRSAFPIPAAERRQPGPGLATSAFAELVRQPDEEPDEGDDDQHLVHDGGGYRPIFR